MLPTTARRSPWSETEGSDALQQGASPGIHREYRGGEELLLEADGFYASGRFDLAFKRYEQVLNIDKYNIAARAEWNASTELAKSMRWPPTTRPRRRCCVKLIKDGELPVRRFEVGVSTIIEQPQIDTRGTSLINRKLDEIIIPRNRLPGCHHPRSCWILSSSAGGFLDTSEEDPSRRGINIVLRRVRRRCAGSRLRITLL